MSAAHAAKTAGPAVRGDYRVRQMARSEVSLAIDWAAAEGWNPGLDDAECFFAADPNGFFLGELDGEPIGCCSAVAYDDAFAFFGLYIVKPGFRGQGFGSELARAAFHYIGARNAGLDGVVAMQDKYARLGFRFAHRNVRYHGVCEGERRRGIVDLALVPFHVLSAYDRLHFPAPRTAFLKRWIDRPGGAALGFVEAGRLCGYAVLRPCRSGFKIGPLFADSEPIADALFLALATRSAGQPIVLDTPQSNPRAIALAERYGMEPVFETARMYRQGAPAVPLENVFGITTFELG